MDENGVLNKVFDPATGVINVTLVAGPAGPVDTPPMDANGVWNSVYDPDTNTIRVVEV